MKKTMAGSVLTTAFLFALASPAAAKDPKVGAKVKVNNGSIAVLTYEQPAAIADDDFIEDDPGEDFVAIEVKACNKSDDVLTLLPSQFQLELSDHSRVDNDFVDRDPALHTSDLAEGDCVKGWVTFSVPEDKKVKLVRFTGGSPLSDDRSIVKWRVTKDVTVSTTTTTPPALITKEEFDQIQPGMSLDQVVAVVGAPGVVESESGSGDFSFAIYSWEGPRGANATIFFQQGAVSSKNQFGLD